MRLPGKPAVWTAALLVATILFIVLILPGIIRNMAVERIEQATGRKASIAGITLNPFTWSAEVTGFRLAEKDGKRVFASFSSARVKVSPASISKRALIVSKLRITSPYLHLVRTAPNAFNFSDLVPKKKKPAEGETFPFSINNIEIGNGSIDFHDLAAAKPTEHSVRHMELSVPFISTIPYLADIYVAPRFSALINGARFSANGRLKPLEHAAETSVILILRDADLPYYAAYIPFALPITVKSGKLTTTAEVTYRVSAKAHPEVTVSGALALRGLLLKDRADRPLLALGMGTVRINRLDIMARKFDLASVETAGLEAFPERDEKGVWIWRRLFPGEAAAVGKIEKEKAPLLLKIAQVRSRGGKIHFRDRLPSGGFTSELDSLNLTMNGLSTAPGQKADLDLSFRSTRDESVAVKGALAIEPLAVTARLDAKGIDLGGYHPYLARQLASPVTGRLDTSASITFSKDTGLMLDGITLAVHGLAAEFGNREGIRLPEVSAAGGKVDLKENRAELESVKLSGGDIRLSREEGGRLSFERLLLRKEGAKEVRAAKAPPPTPFSYHVKRVEGEGLDISFIDRTREGSPAFPLRRLRFSLQDISGPKADPIPFKLATSYGKRGSIGASGTVLPSPLKVRGSVDLQRIPLRDFDAYLPDNLAVSLAGGAVDSRMTFDLSHASGKLTGSYGGSLGVRSFYCLDTRENEDLLKWERLQLNGIKGTLSPLSLSIGDISLSDYYSRIIVTKDGTLNLQNLMEEKAGAQPPAQPGRTAQSTPSSEPSMGKPNIRIGTVTLQGGTMVFSDRHIPTPFTTTFYNLGGRISGLSSEETRAAGVDLRGNLENHSPLSITGSINPLRKDLFVDLTIDFSDIELSPTTPYTGTYLGYAVDKGKLSLSLKYHIENKELKSENKIFFDQLTFGKKVESDKATSLPVRLAVALLKDRKGEIHLDLPVTGRTDDPKFSIWGLVFKVLKNLLVKAATSPFALLQAAFGGKEDFSSVTFSPGSADLTQPEQDKLRKLAGAILDRPELNVEISGYVDREKDPEGYRRELLAKKMRTEKFLALVKQKRNTPGQSPETTEILPDEYSSYLKAVYRKEKFSKPRNLIGMLKDLPDDEMKKLIFTHTVVGDAELQSLARERAAVVYAWLVDKGKVAKERVFLKSGDIFKAAEEGRSGSRVEFGAVVK
jgi:hypothetical protein